MLKYYNRCKRKSLGMKAHCYLESHSVMKTNIRMQFWWSQLSLKAVVKTIH